MDVSSHTTGSKTRASLWLTGAVAPLSRFGCCDRLLPPPSCLFALVLEGCWVLLRWWVSCTSLCMRLRLPAAAPDS